MKEKISVLICAYNSEKTIWKCARSAALQKYRPLEIILIDDGSTDKTAKLADLLMERYPEVKTIHQRNQGIAAARNQALKVSSGEWIFYLDSDDRLAEDALTLMAEEKKRFQADCVIGAHQVHYGSLSWRIGVKRRSLMSQPLLMKALLKDRQIKNYSWGKLFDRRLLKEMPFVPGRSFEDVYVMADILGRAKRPLVIPQVVYHYTVGRPGSISYGLKPEAMSDYLIAQRKQIQTILKRFPALEPECKKAWRRVSLLNLFSRFRYGIKSEPQIARSLNL